MDPHSYARAFAVLQEADDVDAILMTGYFGGYSSGEDGLTGLGPAECAAAKQIAADAGGRKPVAVQSIFPRRPRLPDPRRRRGPGVRAPSRTRRRPWPRPRSSRAQAAPSSRCPSRRPPLGRGRLLRVACRLRRGRACRSSPPARSARRDELREAAERSCGRRTCSRPWACCTSPTPAASWSGCADRQALYDGPRSAGRAAGPAGVLRRGDGRPAQRRRADRRRQVGPALRADRAGRHGRHRHRGARRRPGRARARSTSRRRRGCCAGCVPLPCSTSTAVGRRWTSTRPPASVAALSRFAAAHPEIAEFEVNPLLVTPAGAVALDARIVTAPPDHTI